MQILPSISFFAACIASESVALGGFDDVNSESVAFLSSLSFFDASDGDAFGTFLPESGFFDAFEGVASFPSSAPVMI